MERIKERLNNLIDTRRQWGKLRHMLVDIAFIGLVSIICGGTDFEHIEDTGNAKLDWFKKHLELPIVAEEKANEITAIPELIEVIDVI